MKERFRFRAWDKHAKVMKYSVSPYLLNEHRYVIMQCTGLKDKNGTYIYEGDKVRINDKNATVVWDDKFGAYDFCINEVHTSFFETLSPNAFEVIGNKYEKVIAAIKVC